MAALSPTHFLLWARLTTASPAPPVTLRHTANQNSGVGVARQPPAHAPGAGLICRKPLLPGLCVCIICLCVMIGCVCVFCVCVSSGFVCGCVCVYHAWVCVCVCCVGVCVCVSCVCVCVCVSSQPSMSEALALWLAHCLYHFLCFSPVHHPVSLSVSPRPSIPSIPPLSLPLSAPPPSSPPPSSP